VLPVPLGYIPTTTIGNFIYTGGGSAFDPVAIPCRYDQCI